MLDLARCRELLGETELTDQQVDELRAFLYGLAQLVVDGFEERRPLASPGTLWQTRP